MNRKLHPYLSFFIMAFYFSITFGQAQGLVATCSGTPLEIYFGLAGFQTATITGTATGGTGPYTIAITLNRPVICNYIDAAGNETFVGIGGQTTNGNCINGSPNQPPVAIMTNAVAGVPFAVNATLLAKATFTITVTDATGSSATCSVTVFAEDVRCFAGNSPPHKIAICHKTNSVTNPVVLICVDESAVARHIDNHGDFPAVCDATTGKCSCPGTIEGTHADVKNELKEKSVKRLDVKATPNPSAGYFTLKTQSASDERLQLKVVDMLGRVVETKSNIEANSTITFGSKYRPGAYLVELIQGGEKRMLRLLKQ